jgi:hypothetical protein
MQAWLGIASAIPTGESRLTRAKAGIANTLDANIAKIGEFLRNIGAKGIARNGTTRNRAPLDRETAETRRNLAMTEANHEAEMCEGNRGHTQPWRQ